VNDGAPFSFSDGPCFVSPCPKATSHDGRETMDDISLYHSAFAPDVVVDLRRAGGWGSWTKFRKPRLSFAGSGLR
jgi:hypothetical protein